MVEWQTVNRSYNDFEQELIVYFSISNDNLKYVTDDSTFYAEYEVQIKIFDKQGAQLTGDYWEGITPKNDEEVDDSVRIIIPKASRHYDLKIIDLNAGLILNVSQKIVQINHIGSIKWDISADTLSVVFSIINPEGEAINMIFAFDELEQSIKLEKGIYDDTVIFYIAALPNGDFTLNVKTFSPLRRIDETEVPIKIARPFYLDETTWYLKINQLEYIATTSEIRKLRDAKFRIP